MDAETGQRFDQLDQRNADADAQRLLDRGRYIDRFDVIDRTLREHTDEEQRIWGELRASQASLSEDIRAVATAQRRFADEYRTLMLGEEKLQNGSGLLSEVREIKKSLAESPSLVAIIKKNPIRTIVAAVAFVGGGTTSALAAWIVVHTIAHIPAIEAYVASLMKLPPPPVP